jgi:hypothetical protein
LKHGGHAGWGDCLARGDDPRIAHTSVGLFQCLSRANGDRRQR